MQRGDFLHHRFVDGEAAGRVDQQHVVVVALGPVERGARDVHRLLIGFRREQFGADLLGHRLQLLDSGGAVDVARNGQHFLLALLAQQLGELAGGGRLTRALQAGHQDHGGRLTARLRSAALPS